jgi:hypothetical protein
MARNRLAHKSAKTYYTGIIYNWRIFSTSTGALHMYNEYTNITMCPPQGPPPAGATIGQRPLRQHCVEDDLWLAAVQAPLGRLGEASSVHRDRVLAASEADGEELVSCLQHLVRPVVQGASGGTTPPRLTNTYSAFISLSRTEAAASAYVAGLVGRAGVSCNCLT